VAFSFIDGVNRSARRKPSTWCKSLTNFFTSSVSSTPYISTFILLLRMSWSHGRWIYYCLSPISRTPFMARCTRYRRCEKVCQWLASGRWFSPGTPVYSFGHISESRKTWVTRLLGKFLIMNDLIDLFIVFNATFSFYAECIIMLHGVLLKCLRMSWSHGRWIYYCLSPISRTPFMARCTRYRWCEKVCQ
jgi:hypothetical protein